MAAPRKYPDELRERAIRFALDLVDGPEKLSVNGACRRVGEQLGIVPARVLGEDTLNRCRRVFDTDHATTLAAAAGLTLSASRLGEAELARALGQDTLQCCRRVLGPDHPTMLYLTQPAGIAHLRLDGDAAADAVDRPL